MSLFRGFLSGGLCLGGHCLGSSVSRVFSVCSGESLFKRSLSSGSLSRGSLSRQVSVHWGLCPGEVSVQGVSVQVFSAQGVSVQGVSVQGVSVQWVSVQGGLCPDACENITLPQTSFEGSKYEHVFDATRIHRKMSPEHIPMRVIELLQMEIECKECYHFATFRLTSFCCFLY